MTILTHKNHVFANGKGGMGQLRGRRKLPRKKGATLPYDTTNCKTEHLKGDIHDRQTEFLLAFVQVGTIRAAAEMCGFTSNCCSDWRARDPSFEARFVQAKRDAADLLEEEARRRAVEGVLDPVFYKGEVCGHVRKYSDGLLIKLLKAYRPERFSDNINIKQESTINMKLVIEELKDDLGSESVLRAARERAAADAIDRVARLSSN